MDAKKDNDASKMERILSNHCLDSLVFEKRERKKSPNPLAALYSSIHQKHMQMNIGKQVETPLKSKKQSKARKKESKKVKEIQNMNLSKPKNRGRPKKSDKLEIMQQKVIKCQESEEGQIQDNLPQSQNKEYYSFQMKQQRLNNKFNVKKESQGSSNKIEQKVKDQNLGLQHIEQKFKENSVLNNQEMQQQSQKQQDDLQEYNNGRILRARKTKGEALKRFTMIDDIQQDDQQQQVYYGGRRKRVGGSRNTIKGLSRYSLLNRIFRKTQKKQLPAFSLSVDILEVDFKNFTEKFGAFDMAHFSLPIQMLSKIPDINALIPKGFVFIWAQKKQIAIGYHILNRWGFDVIDQIMWIKTDQNYSQLVNSQNDNQQMFRNCRTTCLVGYKCSLTQKTEYCTKISNNIIFAKQKLQSIKKPDEIYEIGDLMMPGAKKIEIGYKQVGGWMALTHRQKSFIRCNQCLIRHQKSQLYLLPRSKQIKCQKCVNKMQISESGSQSNNNQERKSSNSSNSKSNISETLTIESYKIHKFEIIQNKNLCCSKCNNKPSTLKGILLDQINNTYLCLQCVQNKQYTKLSCYYLKQYYFLNRSLVCSNCKKMKVCREYYECITCKKDHLICSACFWQKSITIKSQNHQKDQKQKQQTLNCHQWRHKQIISGPENKALCFHCLQECLLPYWACETCQGWYWCGNCNIQKSHSAQIHHCHNFHKHYQYLIV